MTLPTRGAQQGSWRPGGLSLAQPSLWPGPSRNLHQHLEAGDPLKRQDEEGGEGQTLAHRRLLQASQNAGEFGVLQAGKWGGPGVTDGVTDPMKSWALCWFFSLLSTALLPFGTGSSLILVTEPCSRPLPSQVTLPHPVLCTYSCTPPILPPLSDPQPYSRRW